MTDIGRIADVYIEVLSNRMGLDVSLKRNFLTFSPTEGLTVVIPLFEDDPEFVHLLAPFQDISSDLTPAELDRICSDVTRRVKGVAVTADTDGDLEFSVSWPAAAGDCLPTADHLQVVLPRAISMLVSGINATLTEVTFAEIVQEEHEDS